MADSDNLNPSRKTEDPNSSSFMEIEGSEEDKFLGKSKYLTRKEVLKRRLRRTRQLKRCYTDHYWAFMEDLRSRYRHYCWTYGKSPFKEDEEREEAVNVSIGEDPHGNRNNTSNGNSKLGYEQCKASGCKTKAMALTRFCHNHVLLDSNQVLYTGCSCVTKSGPTGHSLCGKPILKSTVPANCWQHVQNAEKHVLRALKRGGLNVFSSNNRFPRYHSLVAAYVGQVKKIRRASPCQNTKNVDKIEVKEEDTILV